jgi:hypothetical protein
VESAGILGDMSRAEAANPTTYANATDLLVSRGVLIQHQTDLFDKKGKPKGQERVLEVVLDRRPLEELQKELAVSGPLRGSFGA